jgi:hypothetical protein
VLTLAMLAVAWLAARTRQLGRASLYVQTVAYSATFFFHFIPGVTETFTRFPRGAPLFAGPEDPALAAVIGVLFLCFLVGVGWQLYRLRGSQRTGNAIDPMLAVDDVATRR